jgi:hypothetical protein
MGSVGVTLSKPWIIGLASVMAARTEGNAKDT